MHGKGTVINLSRPPSNFTAFQCLHPALNRNIIITQFKFALAIIASSFGGCHPHVMVGSILLVVGSQLLIYWHGSAYSSVHPVSHHWTTLC